MSMHPRDLTTSRATGHMTQPSGNELALWLLVTRRRRPMAIHTFIMQRRGK